MSSQPFTVFINGNPNVPTIREVRIRPAPGTTQPELFKVPVGMQNCRVLEVQPDQLGASLNNKVHQWFKIILPDSRVGWIRDDLVNIIGDGTLFGYPILTASTYAFSVVRTANINPGATPAATSAATTSTGTAPAATTPTTPKTTTSETRPITSPPLGPVVPTPVPPPGTVLAVCISQIGANMRAAPVNGAVLERIGYLAQVTVLGAAARDSSSNYTWIQVRAASGKTGFVRDSFLKLIGDASRWDLSKGDEYPAPMRAYWWVRGFGIGFPGNDANERQHDGWDLGALTGEPTLAGPHGGVVTQTNVCQKCTPDKPSTVSQNLGVGNPGVLMDPAWGFGYGTYVVMRYDHVLLPASTQERLKQRGMSGAHVFVMYAHLSGFTVASGQQLAGGQQFGTCGNTGNSEAPHLHLEVRAGANPNAQWSQLRAGLLEPGTLFSR